MFKLRHLLQSKSQLSEILSVGKASYLKDAPFLHNYVSKAGISTASQAPTGSVGDRVFVDYSVFKGKAALIMSPILPRFTKLDSGGLKVDRRGVMLLKFMPAVGERKYDWEKKQNFALSATEMGSLISLGPSNSCEFFHDPSMLSSNAGQVRKTLSIKPHADGSGYFISLSVVNNILHSTERMSVPVTTAEFTVIKTACSFALPLIMGWDRLTKLQPGAVEEKPSKVDRQYLDLEWER